MAYHSIDCRRCSWMVVLTLVAGLIGPLRGLAQDAASKPADGYSCYIGTYTAGESEGIYHCRLNVHTGALENLKLAGAAKNPSFLAIHPAKPLLYAVAEVDNLDGVPGGGVAAFAMAADGSLEPRNAESSGGSGPCHLVVDRAGKNVLVANYGSGSVAVLPIADDGRLQQATSTIQHHGSGPNRERQQGPHAHSINLDADNRFAFVADLGLDRVCVYRFDPAAGTLVANEPPALSLPPGAGPRHFAFHPGGRWAYVINELDSTITALAYDKAHGTLEPLHTVSTLPADAKVSSTTAEVVVHPSGKWVYGSNRGHDSIAVFAVDPSNGRLTPLAHHPTGGRTPRNFNIDPSGQYLLAANQESDSITVHKIDPATGLLKSTGQSLRISMPVCVKFLDAGR